MSVTFVTSRCLSGKCRTEANTWEPVGFPVDGKIFGKRGDREIFSNQVCVKWEIKASAPGSFLDFLDWVVKTQEGERGEHKKIILFFKVTHFKKGNCYFDIVTLQNTTHGPV